MDIAGWHKIWVLLFMKPRADKTAGRIGIIVILAIIVRQWHPIRAMIHRLTIVR